MAARSYGPSRAISRKVTLRGQFIAHVVKRVDLTLVSSRHRRPSGRGQIVASTLNYGVPGLVTLDLGTGGRQTA